ncbi:hypothetical protein E2C01_033189 [Portunus trituberculatus]|uniref:Uncharacterized protein n=1 Tax=Portunus trituberculatus TaxID=210409 RepID=A0A5B7F4X2_PORTR|nr:hypothetical protein [Portunus trituberculatus]
MGTLLWMLIDHPHLITQKKEVLVYTSSGEEHPIMRHTQLMACILSGGTCETKEFLRQFLCKVNLYRHDTHMTSKPQVKHSTWQNMGTALSWWGGGGLHAPVTWQARLEGALAPALSFRGGVGYPC